MKRAIHISIILIIATACIKLQAQTSSSFDGQLSAFASFNPDASAPLFLGARYLPKFSFELPIDSSKMLDFEVSLNLTGSSFFEPLPNSGPFLTLDPYRFWARYTSKQFELRLGLQKIDFGSASILRPLQWFNQIDPRDPLRLTYGVYGALGRYYFLDNSNVWLWVLYGNEKGRGFDFFPSNSKRPEFGGRIQVPLGLGEIAFSYHNREVQNLLSSIVPANIQENKYGIDGKWDLGVGVWFESTYSKFVAFESPFTHQMLVNVGMDYTFPFGNGLNVIGEYLLLSYDHEAFAFDKPIGISALMTSYPLGLFDTVSSIFSFNHSSDDLSVFVNFQHDFPKMTGYIMLYYNPEAQQGITNNELVNTFVGPGIQLMLVYNH